MNIIRLLLTVMIIASVNCVFGCDMADEGAADYSVIYAAEEEVSIDGRNYKTEASLWVNLMPPVPEEGPDLNVITKIIAADGDDFPDAYGADFVWLIQGETVIPIELEDEKPRELSGNNVLELVGRTKEKLDPDIPVDVATRVVTAAGEEFYLCAPDNMIIVTH